ncbi:MAG: hypothetical protein IKF71_05640 [Bacilli bacterium]|nr:hypothetical protein [Bacilli bacterium]
MNLSLFEKIGVIFRYIFSSFLSIEILIISLLLFAILIFNIKRNNRMVQIAAIGVYLGFILGILISYTSYVQTSFDSFVKEVMNYIYFPSTIVYFFIMVFVIGMMIYTIFSKKLTILKKVINYAIFSIMFFFFVSFLSLAAYNAYDLIDITKLYENDVILSIIQVSNLLLFIWLIFTGFYHLYHFYKKKFDKE